MDHEANFCKKFANVKSQRAKTEESFAPAIEEDESVKNLLAEPKTDNLSSDGVLNFGEKNAGKGLENDGFSYGNDYFLDSFRGGFGSRTAQQGVDEFELGVLDGLLDEVEEVEDLHAADGLASPSEDFFLEIGFAAKASAWDYPPRERSNLRNIRSESQSPGLSGSSNSAVTVQESECKNDSLIKTETKIFRHKKRRKTQVHNDDDDPLLCTMLINKKVKNSGEANKAGREKRLRRPTQRYIEAFTDKHRNGEGNVSLISKEKDDKQAKVRSHDELYPARLGMLSSVPEELVGSTKVSARRGRPKKQFSISPPVKLEEESFESESEDDRVVRKRSDKHDRRKQQRMWTITEVIRLVDGISEFGVGRWTDIKRLLFATSAYRTPIDLRDKWRNLLRACSLHKLKKKEPSHPLRPLPKSVIRRVCELAKIHPYPRERGQKKT